MRDQQTFVQRIKSTGYQPITREMVATALENMANQLRQPFDPDTEGRCAPITWNQRFEIRGKAWLGNSPEEGMICLVFK